MPSHRVRKQLIGNFFCILQAKLYNFVFGEMSPVDEVVAIFLPAFFSGYRVDFMAMVSDEWYQA